MKHDLPMSLTATLHSADDPAVAVEFAGFVAQCPGATYLQDAGWPGYAPDGGGRHGYALAMVRDPAGQPVLAGLLRRTGLPGGVALGAFRRGPLVRRVSDLAPGLSALLPVLRTAGYASVTLNPRWYDDDAEACEAALADLGATVVEDPRQTLHNVTGLVDLDRSPEEILAAGSKSLRTLIRKLDRQGLSIRQMTEADLALYAEWRKAFVADRGMSVAGQPSVAAQLAHVREKGGLAAMAELNGAPCGAFVAFRDGDRILPISDAWADPRINLPRGYLFLWALIHTGQGMAGLRWLDVAGISDQTRLMSRDPEAAKRAAQRDEFKMRFRPRVVAMPRIHEFVLRPMLHRLAMAAKGKR